MAIVALIGRPNVGKSTLFNRMIGQRKAIEAAEAGTTRDRIYGVVNKGKHHFTLVDVAGIIRSDDKLDMLVSEQVKIAQSEADLFLFIVDASAGLTAEDQHIAEMIRKLNKSVIVVANKADHSRIADQSYEFARLGLGDVLPVSAIHNIGVDDVIEKTLSALKIKESKISTQNEIKVAILGRPNVGKSTLLNKIVGLNRSIVSPVAGTTRDAVDVGINYKNVAMRFVDTAGIRRSGKISVGIEKFSVMRAVKIVSEANIVILLIDANEGPTSGDTHIASLALEYGTGLILAVNKWDRIPESRITNHESRNNKLLDNQTPHNDDELQRQFIGMLQSEFAFVPWAPVVFISAQEGLNTQKLLELVRSVSVRRQTSLTDSQLEEVKKVAETGHTHLPMMYKISQSGIKPPHFTVLVNRPETWHFSYSRYLENIIRDAEPYTGTPIKIEIASYHRSK